MNEATFCYLLGVGIGCALGVVVIAPEIDRRKNRRRFEVENAIRNAFEHERQMAAIRQPKEETA